MEYVPGFCKTEYAINDTNWLPFASLWVIPLSVGSVLLVLLICGCPFYRLFIKVYGMSPTIYELSRFRKRAISCSFDAHQSFHLKSYIFLIFGMMLDLCSAITNFMEFIVILEKCQLHMLVINKVQVLFVV